MSTISLTKPKATEVTSVWPQVDLLPPEVRQGRKLGQTKRLLVLGVLVVLLIGALGWVYSFKTLKDAQQELADAQARTEQLTAEQATYAEVPQIQSELARTQNALQLGTSTEILWKPYLEALRAVTPAGVSYDTMQVTLTTDPSQSVSTDPLQAPSIGRIQITGRATTLPDLSAWMDAVRTIPGLADPWFTQAAITDDNGNVYYQITGSVQIADTALAHRFASAEEASD